MTAAGAVARLLLSPSMTLSVELGVVHGRLKVERERVRGAHPECPHGPLTRVLSTGLLKIVSFMYKARRQLPRRFML